MKNCPVEYWIWLQSALGAGARVDEILGYFETPEELYSAGEFEWKLSGTLTPKKMNALKSTSLSVAEAVIRQCKENGFTIVTPESPNYPERLRKIKDYPLAIYCRGDESVLNAPVSIGIVGTRKAGEYGTKTAQRLSYQIAQTGAVVVSGGALGVDSEAHAGAMLADGKTIAYLGCGLATDYLRENASLRRAIARHGVVASEYQPFEPASTRTFPIRNRLISGTSLGVVVIEAGVKSGSLITAKVAVEQGRSVFAVPGDILRSSFDGGNFLIKNGAKAVFSAYDVLSEFEYLYNEHLKMENADCSLEKIPYVDYRNYKKNKSRISPQSVQQEKEKAEPTVEKRTISDDISENAKIIYSVIEEDAIHIDDIVRKTNLKMNEVLSCVTELELFGYVEAMSGKKYKIK